jgi:LysM repeat protein
MKSKITKQPFLSSLWSRLMPRWYNLFMRPAVSRLFWILVILLSACTQTNSGISTPVLSHITLEPYHTPVQLPVGIASPETGETLVPTQQPVIYTVVAGDNLSTIAFRFGVELNALVAANPGVNANAMAIGIKLTIPKAEGTTGVETGSLTGLPTPVITTTQKPDCHRLDDGQWICFLMVHNPLDEGVGNIIGRIWMPGAPTVYTATCPLDMIPEGVDVPLIALIQDDGIKPEVMTGNLTSAIPIDLANARLRVFEINEYLATYPTDRRSVIIDGEIIPEDSGMLRVLVYAQDAQEHVMGYRLWEPRDPTRAGSKIAFQIYLYSLGGAIAHIHLIAQIRVQ